MNRTKTALINTITAAVLSITQITIGIILPRLIIGYYGSETNGLTVSIQQYIGYLSYLEFGLSSVFIFALYKPLAENSVGEINSLVKSAKKSYNRTSTFYLLGVIILAALYPILTNIGSLDIITVIALVFIIGLGGVLDMFSLSKYRVLLTADQKVYVLNFFSILSYLLNFLVAFLLIYFNQHIILVKASALLPILFRTIFLHVYVKKKYPYLSFSKEKTKIRKHNYSTPSFENNETDNFKEPAKKVKRFDAVLMQLSKSIAYSLPVLILSIFSSLKIVSVFSVYYLVFNGLQTVIATITMGSTAAFGNMFSRNETENIKKVYSEFEFILTNVQVVLYSTAIILMVPFLYIYLKNISDMNDYINLGFAVLFVVWAYLDNLRLPAQTIIQAAGKFKETRWSNIIYMAVELILLLILVPFFDIYGALIAMIVSSSIKLIWFVVIVNKHIIPNIYSKSIRRFIVGFLIIGTSFFIFNYLIELPINTIFLFIIFGFAFVLTFTLIVVLLGLLLDKKDIKSTLQRLNIFGRLNKKPLHK